MVKFNKICVLKPKLNEQQFGQETDDDNNSYSIEINNLNAVDRENLMDTIREGQALLRRFDNASIQTCSMHTSMNDEIIDAVFGVDKKVKGCGFRDGQLQIHVQMPSLKCERQRIKSEMSDVLKTFKIDHMVIFGDYDITPFSGSKVGDKAENILGRTGTLGGFARIEGHLSLSECQLCALFARHFADPDEDNEEPPVYIFDQSGNKTAIGVVHRGNGKNKYDISAVAVVSEVGNNKFKTSEGLYSPSQLCLFEHDQLAKFEELQVYIWANGEATPRRGKITIPYYRCRAMDGHYVLIEDLCVWDRETNALVRKRLCESGHSGAIFCSDDPNGKSINVYSMLVGMWNYKEVDNDASHKGVYMTFAVCKGLEDLSDKLGADIKLC
ncbi:uncharacterized protein LOC128228761 [Mya arenaria]|nr:uncharacterized protein LOC128228761 [Mya arenaria]